jgi:hypothetical protein
MTDSMAQELISKIRGRKYAGSSLKNGKLYHDLPFPGFENFDSHRSKTKVRWNYIRKYVSGASKVLGVDYDRESIDLAKYVANKVGAKNVEFRCSNIDSKFAEELDYFDVVIWLSQWMWIVKQLGMDEAKKLLFLISKKSAIMIFESAADDGMAAITGMTQSDIEDIFRKNTCYSKVKNIGSTPGWKMRNILIGEI